MPATNPGRPWTLIAHWITTIKWLTTSDDYKDTLQSDCQQRLATEHTTRSYHLVFEIHPPVERHHDIFSSYLSGHSWSHFDLLLPPMAQAQVCSWTISCLDIWFLEGLLSIQRSTKIQTLRAPCPTWAHSPLWCKKYQHQWPKRD